MQEFSVITSNFSAQYGRASGGVVNVATKSGTNQFRGTVYEFFRNDALVDEHLRQQGERHREGQVRPPPDGLQPRRSRGEGQGPLLRERRVHPRPVSTDTQISWVPTPELIAASAPATQQFFSAYGGGATINGPILTRGDVSAIVGTAAGAFNNLPAGLPAFGQVEKSLPIDAGGGDPQNDYQVVGRLDFSLSTATQAYVRYAYQHQEPEPGTNSVEPLRRVRHGLPQHEPQRPRLADPRLLAELHQPDQGRRGTGSLNDQPLNGDPQPTLYMNPTTAVRLQGYRIAFPGYLPWNPGSAIPFGGPQKQLAFYQDFNWVKGKHDIRFGGSYMHMNGRPHVRRLRERGRVAQHHVGRPALARQPRDRARSARFQGAINPERLPGRHVHDAGGLPELPSNNTLQRVRALRATTPGASPTG